MAKMTKVFGAILCVLGTVYTLVSIFLYLNSSANLDYNTGKLQTMSQAGVFYYLMFAVIILVFGIILAKDKVLNNDHH
jgi:hypothetical protein